MNRVLAALLMLLLAGCTSEPDVETATDVAPQVITDPSDFSYNTSSAHTHDYWGGQDRLTIMERTHEVGSSSTGTTFVDFRPDRDEVVPQGTATVEVTFTWTPDAQAMVGEASLHAHGADTFEWTDFGRLENGVPFVIESHNGMNDLPHARLSGWEFAIGFEPDPVIAHWSGTMHVFIEAVRGLEIPAYPGHPDRWQSQDELPLFDESGLNGFGTISGGRACLSGCPDFDADLNVVPHDADHVRIVVSAGDGNVFRPGLMYHGADTWEWTVVEAAATAGDTSTYVVPLDGNGDGPYAPRSLWQFRLIGDQPDGSTFVGQYSVQAFAVRTPA